MYEIMEKENIVIEDMIYTIRGVQVMLDKDVAKLYQVETKRLNEVTIWFNWTSNNDVIRTFKSDIAVKVNIQIINAFVYMRKYISKDLNNNILINHENRILKLEESFNRLNNNTKVNTVFYDGQIYDAYSLFMDILNKAKKEIIIIDNHAGKELLDILKNIKTNIVVVSSNIDDTLKKSMKCNIKM